MRELKEKLNKVISKQVEMVNELIENEYYRLEIA